MKQSIALIAVLILIVGSAGAQLSSKGSVYDSTRAAANPITPSAGKNILEGFGERGIRLRDNREITWIVPAWAQIKMAGERNQLAIWDESGNRIGGMTGNRGGTRIADSAGYPTFVSMSKAMILEEEFLGSTTAGQLDWGTSAAGTAAAASISAAGAAANHPGLVRLSTGSDVTGRVTHHLGITAPSIFFDGGGAFTWQAEIKLNALSTAADEYDVLAGFGDAVTSGIPTNFLGFMYDRNATGGTFWQIVKSIAGAQTITASTKTVSSADFVKLRIEITTIDLVYTAPFVSAEFFVNGASIGNLSPIPTAAVAPMFKIEKSATTGAISVIALDYMYINNFFGTPR